MTKPLLTAAALTLLLSACGGHEPAVTPPAALTTLTGTLVESVETDDLSLQTKAWTGGAGTVRVVSPNADGSDATVASGTLAASGAFSVALQAPTSPLEPVSAADLDSVTNAFVGGLLGDDLRDDLNCTGQPSLSDPSVRATVGVLRVDADQDGSALPLTLRGSETDTNVSLDLGLGVLMYADRPVNLTGREVCTLSDSTGSVNYTTNYDLRLAQGWNKVSFKSAVSVTATTQTATLTITTSAASGSFPTENWVFLEGGDVATPLSLPGKILR